MNRKEFLKSTFYIGAGVSLIGCLPGGKSSGMDDSWDGGEVNHILPIVSDSEIAIAISFKSSVTSPRLKTGEKVALAVKRDSKGYFWNFHFTELESGTEFILHLSDGNQSLCDPWPLRTFPGYDSSPSELNLLVYTCPGGHPYNRDLMPDIFKENKEQFVKRRLGLLKKGLSMQPHAIISIGDQIYWDLGEVLPGIPGEGENEMAYEVAGKFDQNLPVIGSQNEQVLRKAIDPQVAQLYGTMLRSTPIFMLPDDHDYFANDFASKDRVTFPPKDFNLNLARITQSMYWPTFLGDKNRPADLPGSNASDRLDRSSESFGTLRYGNLAEILLYDCRRFTSLTGSNAGFIPNSVEKWLWKRSNSKDVLHTIHIPSLPIGWSAGKWMEWYPDMRDSEGILSDRIEKYAWQSGWQKQHDRILKMLTNSSKKPIFLQGDLHTFAAAEIHRSNDVNLDKNPVTAIIVGSLGSTAFPSAARGIKASVPCGLEVNEYFENLEESGFSMVKIDESGVKVRMYNFLSGRDDIADILNLKPFTHFNFQRRNA